MEPESQTFARRIRASLERLEQGLLDILRDGLPAVRDADLDFVLPHHAPHRDR